MQKNKRFKAATIAGFIALSFLATACETVEGVGQDTQKLGKDIENSANRNK